MPFWPLRPVRAQNQLRFGLNPQQPPTVMRRQAFGFGPARSFCVSCCENSLCNSVSTMGCSPHSMRWSISSPGCSAVVAQGWLQRHPKSRGTGIMRATSNTRSGCSTQPRTIRIIRSSRHHRPHPDHHPPPTKKLPVAVVCF